MRETGEKNYLKLIEPLNTWSKFTIVHIHSKWRLPALKKINKEMKILSIEVY